METEDQGDSLIKAKLPGSTPTITPTAASGLNHVNIAPGSIKVGLSKALQLAARTAPRQKSHATLPTFSTA